MIRNLKKRLCALAATALCLCLCTSAFAAEITGSSTPESLSASGNVTFTFAIHNDSAATMTDIRIRYNGSEFFTTAGVSIEPGASQSFTSSPLTVPEALIGQPIPFEVTWLEDGAACSAQPTITVQSAVNDPLSQLPQNASLTATRTVSASQASTGEVITLTYTVTNSGVTPITGVSITDKEIGGREPMVKDVTIQPGVPYVFTYDYTMGRSTVTSSPVIAYLLPDGTEGKVTVSERVLGMINSRLSVAVEQGVASEEGQTFTLTLTNDGNQRISKIKITDELGSSVAETFQLAIGESKTLTYTVPTTEARNVVFNIVGEDGVGQQYSDKTQSYAVRKYIDPSLIGIDFSAAVVETLNSAGSITVNFTVTNTGSLTMEDMVLRESEYGEIYRLDTFAPGTQTINQKVNVGTPRDLTFTLEIADPSGNLYTYTAYITADYVGTAASTDETPAIETPADLVAEVGSSVSSALRTVLIVLAVLTFVAGVALVILSALEKKERERIARRRAARERKRREQALEAAGMLPRSRSSLPPDNGTTRIPPTRK
jgi:conserved repeat protein